MCWCAMLQLHVARSMLRVPCSVFRLPCSVFPCVLCSSIILETDAAQITQRVAMRGSDKEIPLAEQSFSQALQTARDQLVRSFR